MDQKNRKRGRSFCRQADHFLEGVAFIGSSRKSAVLKYTVDLPVLFVGVIQAGALLGFNAEVTFLLFAGEAAVNGAGLLSFVILGTGTFNLI
jgi:hypothetical protein